MYSLVECGSRLGVYAHEARVIVAFGSKGAMIRKIAVLRALARSASTTKIEPETCDKEGA